MVLGTGVYLFVIKPLFIYMVFHCIVMKEKLLIICVVCYIY